MDGFKLWVPEGTLAVVPPRPPRTPEEQYTITGRPEIPLLPPVHVGSARSVLLGTCRSAAIYGYYDIALLLPQEPHSGGQKVITPGDNCTQTMLSSIMKSLQKFERRGWQGADSLGFCPFWFR